MDDRTMRFRVGVMVVATILITGILLIIFGSLSFSALGLGQEKYSLQIELEGAPGVTQNTPVRKSGILIGRVTNIVLPDDGGVVLTVEIDGNRRIGKNEECRVSRSLIGGDSALEFVPIKGDKTEGFLQDGDVVQIGSADIVDPMKALANLQRDIAGATQTVQRAGNSINELAMNVNRLVTKNDGRIEKILAHTDEALVEFRKSMSSLNEIVGDPNIQKDLRTILSDLPPLLQKANKTIDSIERSAKLAERNLTSLKKFTDPLGERGDEMAQSLGNSLENLDTLLEQMSIFSTALNNRKGTLGQLVHNPDLYQNINRAAQNIETATRKLKPIMDDAREIADKINRNPGIILRDAVRPGAGLKHRSSKNYR